MNIKMNKKSYITTTIPYVNAAPHIGHALEFVQADVIARFRRVKGDETYFLSGSDENAIKNVQAAEKEGIPTEELVQRNADAFRDLLKKLNISVDQFIRTSEERHKIGAQALWSATKKEDLYKKKYQGLYCQGCETFYNKDELNEAGECSEHPGKKLEVIEEENYFFKLSNYQKWLTEVVEKDELKIVPQSKKNEVLAFIKRGLEDFSVSRPVERTKNWGVRVPNEPGQTMYVWYDALANYITALGYPDVNAKLFKTFWLENDKKIHVLGKGVSRFHAVYWLAMLKSAGLPIPNEEFIHGYITVEGQKISKTVGNVIDPFDVISRYGVDSVRYYLLREIPAYEDGDFSEEKFKDRYNGDLANGLGNFTARVLTLGAQVGEIKIGGAVLLEKSVEEKIATIQKEMDIKLNEYRFHDALSSLWELIRFGDGYVNDKKPWEIADPEEKKRVIFNLITILDNVAAFLLPFLPETSEKITKNIYWKNEETLITAKPETLFPRIK